MNTQSVKACVRALRLLCLAAVLAGSVGWAAAGEILIPRGSVWKYHNLNQNLGTDWRQIAYADTSWPSGPGPLGNGDTHIVTPINIGPDGARYPTIYFRYSFTVGNAAAYESLIVRVLRDDGAIVYLNGTEVVAANVTTPIAFSSYSGVDAGSETQYFEFTIPTTELVDGLNVLAVELKQATAGSSDLGFDLELEAMVDNVPPTIVALDPPAGAIVLDLYYVNVVFDAAVSGIDKSDLLINGQAATNMVFNTSRDYTFYFPRPPTGAVQVAWTQNHGITDTSPLANPFAGGSWSYTYDPNASPKPTVLLSEFMADNEHGIQDEDGNRSDWMEILNLGPLEADLSGWYLTDTATNLTKWRFPSGMPALQANNYLLVWASQKDKANPLAPLHTNFRLDADGDFVALVDPQTNIVSAFNLTTGTPPQPINYPPQFSDVSYGRDRSDPTLIGYFSSPTPGAPNAQTGGGFVEEPKFSVESGVYTNTFTVTLFVTNAPPGSVIRYTLNNAVPVSNSTTYAGPLTVGSNTVLKARTFPPAGSPLFPSRVMHKSYIFLGDDFTRNFSSKLPVVLIHTLAGIPPSVPPGGTRAVGTMVVLDTVRGRTSLRGPTDFQGLAQFETFGQTSEGFPKRPYRFELNDELTNNLSAPLLGMPAADDWQMRNPYSDKFLLGDFLAFELFEKMGHYQVRRRLVESFVRSTAGRIVSNDYQGVHLLLEKIEVGKDRVNISELTPYHTNEPAISGGYIFKKDKDSAGDLNFSTTGGAGFSGQSLKLHDPKPRQVNNNINHPQVRWLRNYLALMERAMYTNNWLTQTGTNHWSYYIDADSFVDSHWIVEFSKQIDGYRLSNFFTKDRNGKVKMEPLWDWNLAWGNADYLDGGHTNTWYYTQLGDPEHIWLRRLMNGTTSGTGTTGDPDFNQKIADRWSVLRTNIYHPNNVLARIDELGALLNEAAIRDNKRFSRWGTYVWPNPGGSPSWHVDYVRPTNYIGGVNSLIGQMKLWTQGRYNWIDSLYTPLPTFSRPPGMVSPGTTVTLIGASGATVYYTLNGTDPRAPGGTVAPGAQTYSGPITINSNVRLFARGRQTGGSATSRPWNNTWSGPAINTYFTTIPPLRITEVMFNPADPPPGLDTDKDNFEYVEVKNVSGGNLNLSGYSLAGGIQFVFGNLTLNAGQSAVVVKDLAAFQSRYGTNNPNILIAGVFTGNLANGGDHLVLYDSLLVPIHDFEYRDNWYRTTDGVGFSLVADENQPPANWGLAGTWRPSTAIGGSPGTADPTAPPRPPVLINELRSNSDTNLTPGILDAVELHNPTGSPADISGWFLTDDFDTPKKYVFPPNTIIPAGGYLTLTETDFNPDPGSSNSFAFSAGGEDVFLFSGNGTDLTGYVHGFDFGPQAHAVTFGRYVISTGDDHFVTQTSPTLGGANSGPLVGPVVITEINYHPFDIVVEGIPFNNTDDEYIELHNPGGSPVPLYDPSFTTNTWRLTDGVEYSFPQGVSIPAGDYLIVTSIDPNTNAAATAAFRARNFIPDNIPLYGPWSQDLGNEGDSVELRKPDRPTTNGVNYILVERVRYSDNAPWPVGADGRGLTLQRIVPTSYGNDPTNYAATAPTPGGSFTGGTRPMITSQPGDQLLVTGRPATFMASATGTPPLRFQWYFNNLPLFGANSSTLFIPSVQASNAGVYNIFVYNGGGSALGSDFTVTTRIGLQIISQPANRFVRQGGNTNFTVSAIGTGSLRYQWKLNDVNVPNGTNATLTITGAQPVNEGVYRVEVRDDFDTAVSDPATLTLIFVPDLTLQPISQTAVEGSSVSFSSAAIGTTPIGFRWRKGGVTFTGGIQVSSPTNSTLVLTNLRVSDATNYTVVASNIAGTSRVSSNAFLTVLLDSDQDGIPDMLEPIDGAADSDGDGLTNSEEFFAGTDYLDPNSYLKVAISANGGAVLQFNAVSNRTYSVQYTDGLNPILWRKFMDVLSRTNSRTEVLVDPSPSDNRVYRLVTPQQLGL